MRKLVSRFEARHGRLDQRRIRNPFRVYNEQLARILLLNLWKLKFDMNCLAVGLNKTQLALTWDWLFIITDMEQ